MTLTADQYKVRATLEQAFKAQAAQTPPDADSLRGCVMMAVQMAHTLKTSQADLTKLVTEEAGLWEEYIRAKQRLIAKRKADK